MTLKYPSQTDTNLNNNEDAIPTNLVTDFDDIVDQLRGMLNNLQSRVMSLTNDLQTASEISTQVANILELNKLMPRLAQAIKDGFDLHHVNIYLADRDREVLVLTAASGMSEADVKKRNHVIALDDASSVIAHAAQLGRAIIVNDVENDQRYEFQSLVEGTLSSMVVPMLSRGRVIGVLGIQGNVLDRFDDSDVRVKTTLAEQLAVAIQNAEAFAEVQEVRAELLLSNQAIQASNSGVSIADMSQPDQPLMFVNPAFERITGYSAEEVIGKNCRFLQADDRDQEALDVIRDAIANGDACTVELRNYRKDGTLFWNELSLSPLYDDAGDISHFVGVQTDITTRKLAEQRELLAYEIGQQLNVEQEPQALLQLAVDTLSSAFNYYHAHIYRYNDKRGQLQVAAGLGEAGAVMVSEGHSIDYDAPQSLVANAARSLEPVVVMDVSANENHLPNPLIPETLSEVAVPLTLGGELLGVLDVQARETGAFDQSEIRLLRIVSNQLAVALSNAEQLEQTRLRLRDIQIANDAATIIAEAVTVPDMLNRILEVVAEALNVDTAVYTQYLKTENKWQGIAGARIALDFVATIRNDYAEFPHGMEALENGQVVAVDNAYEYAGFPEEYIESMDLKSVAVMPVVGRSGAHGVAFFNCSENFHTFTDGEIQLLEGLSRQIATGIISKTFEESNRRLATLVDTSEDFIAYASLDTAEILYVNEGGVRMLKYDSPDDIIGMTIPDVHTPEGGQRVLNEAVPLLMQGGTWREENTLQARDGEVITVEQNSFVLTDERGEPFAIAAIMQDIRERKKAEADRNRVLEISTDMIGTAGFDGYFRELNPAWERTLGLTPEELMAKPFIEFVHPEDVEATNKAAAGLSEGVPVINFTNRYPTKDGGWRWISWNSTPDYNTEMIYFVARDITEKRQRDELVQQRARNLELVAQVSAQINSIMDPERLVTEVAQLAADAFDLYHIHIWLMDESEENLSVYAGNGRATCHHVDRHFTVNIEETNDLVTEAAKQRKRVLVNDVLNDETYEHTAFLKETQAQVAFPLIIGGRVLGVLDIHSDEVEGFTEEDLLVQETLVAQISVALGNARNFELTQRRASELETVSAIATETSNNLDLDSLLLSVANLTKTSFGLYHAHIYLLSDDGKILKLAAGAGEPGQAMMQRGHSIPMDREDSLVATAARTGEGVIANDVTQAPNFLPNPDLPDTRAEMAIPMVVNRQVVGVLDVQDTHVGRFGPEDVTIKTILAGQIAVSVSNVRSFELTQRRARDLETVSAIATEAANNLDMHVLLMDVVNLTKERFGYYHAHIYLLDDEGKMLNLAAGADAPGQMMMERGHRIPLDREHSLVASAARTGEGVIANDVTQAPDFLPNPLLPETRSELAIPLTVNREVIGVLDVQDTSIGRFGPEDVTLKTILAGQIAVAVANAQRFQAEQLARLENETVARINAALLEANDEQAILSALDPLAEIHPYSFVTMAYTEDENTLVTSAARLGDGNPLPLESLPTQVVTADTFPLLNRLRDSSDPVFILENVEIDDSLNDYEKDLIKSSGMLSSISLIPRAGEDWLGVISLSYAEAQSFSEGFRQVLQRIYPTVTSAIISRLSFLAVQRANAENERRARDLETVSQVSSAASTILDTESLLLSVVHLTKSAFDLYHAHIYIYDEDDGLLRLAAGAGEAGAVMKKHGHSINYNHPSSIVARAAREREGVVINDVMQADTFMPNPLLPDTRAEIALPMMVGSDLVGVLDMQSSKPGYFTDEDVEVKVTLASQIAVAVENARAFERAEDVAERERMAAEESRKAERLKSEFLASMSHELRTPLNSIIGYSEVMLDGGDGDLTEEAMEDIDIIYTSGKHLLSIINDILDLAKIEAEQMKLNRKPTEIVHLLRGVIKANQVLIGDRPIQLLLDTEVDELVIPVDELRIRQVVLNLFSNAVKFTEEGNVTIELSMMDDVTARIAVRDTGIGISEEGQRVVFDQFRQVDGSSTRKAGGTGLGLTITRHLVNMHGGDIYVDSEEGVGSIFWFTLPLIEPEGEEGAVVV